MDDRALKTQKERLAGLDKQLADLAVKQRATESRLDREHQLVRQSASQRAVLVSKLVDAGEEEARKLHKAIDALDAQIKGSERQAEALQHSLKAIADETATLTSERDRVNAIVAQENTSREFQAWSASIKAGITDSSEKLADARLALGRLSIACATGIARFGAAASVLGEQIDKFIHQQANPETLLNFKPALPHYRGDLRAMVSPMVEKR